MISQTQPPEKSTSLLLLLVLSVVLHLLGFITWQWLRSREPEISEQSKPTPIEFVEIPPTPLEQAPDSERIAVENSWLGSPIPQDAPQSTVPSSAPAPTIQQVPAAPRQPTPSTSLAPTPLSPEIPESPTPSKPESVTPAVPPDAIAKVPIPEPAPPESDAIARIRERFEEVLRAPKSPAISETPAVVPEKPEQADTPRSPEPSRDSVIQPQPESTAIASIRGRFEELLRTPLDPTPEPPAPKAPEPTPEPAPSVSAPVPSNPNSADIARIRDRYEDLLRKPQPPKSEPAPVPAPLPPRTEVTPEKPPQPAPRPNPPIARTQLDNSAIANPEPTPLRPEPAKSEPIPSARANPAPSPKPTPPAATQPDPPIVARRTIPEPTPSPPPPPKPVTAARPAPPPDPAPGGPASLLAGTTARSIYDQDNLDEFFTDTARLNPGVDARQNDELGPYLEALRRQILRKWKPSRPPNERKTVILMSILPDGKYVGLKIARTSGSPISDQEALTAIQQAAPFRPLPSSYEAPQLNIEFDFNIHLNYQ